MPGRTPTEAFDDFVAPLKGAVSCLARVNLSVSPGGRTQPGKDHVWTLNDAKGITAQGWHFEAHMVYRIVRTDDDSAWRCTTKMYAYRLGYVGETIWRIHWHPSGNSPITYPHVHAAFDGVPAATVKAHLPAPRMTLEDAIRWAQQTGFTMVRDDWEEVLAMTEADHLRYRSWGASPPR